MTRLLMRLGLEALLNRALEEERTDFVGRERFERTNSPAEEPPHQRYCNGYKPGHVDTTKGRRPSASSGAPECQALPAPDVDRGPRPQCGAGAARGRALRTGIVDP